jgi:hypothetical protein
MNWATVNPARPLFFLTITVFICIGYFAIWFYWKGRNWARIGVLLCSGASILSLLTWNRISPALLTTPAHIMMAGRAVLGAVLLYYLNRRPVVEFFYPENAPPKLGVGRIVFGLGIIATNTKDYAAHPVGTLIVALAGLCVIAWGIRAESTTLRRMRRTSGPLISDAPK